MNEYIIGGLFILLFLIALYLYLVLDKGKRLAIFGGDAPQTSTNVTDTVTGLSAHQCSRLETVKYVNDLVGEQGSVSVLAARGDTGQATGGKPERTTAIAASAVTDWTKCKTWDDIKNDKKLLSAYRKDRMLINKPDFDWSEVLKEVNVKLLENKEYIGIINVKSDKRTLYLAGIEASPVTNEDLKGTLAAGIIPHELAMKWINKPGLILFHTHPVNIGGHPMPSEHDIVTMIGIAALGMFMAEAVISEFGALLYTVPEKIMARFDHAENWSLAVTNFQLDVATAIQGMRSWQYHSFQDEVDFYNSHSIAFIVWPSSEFIAHSFITFMYDMEKECDLELIEHLTDLCKHYRKNKQKAKKPKKNLDINRDTHFK